jgi:hypothetical protein
MTKFADMRAACGALPEAHKAQVAGKVAMDSLMYSREVIGPDLLTRLNSLMFILQLKQPPLRVVALTHQSSSKPQ